MSEQAEARGAPAAQAVQVPVDLVEFEARLLALERRVREQGDRDQLLLDVAATLRRLTRALGPLVEVVGPLVESQEGLPATEPREARPHAPPGPISRRPVSPARRAPAVADSSPIRSRAVEPERSRAVEPERLAAAHARLRAPRAPALPLAPPATAPLFGQHSWLLRALRRMAARDPDSAGRLLVALLAADNLAQIGPFHRLPGPPATVARVVVKGRLRRRLGWEMAQLNCDLTTVSELAKLVRLCVSPAQLHDAGVRFDPPAALALLANAIDPLWTLGHHFTLAHVDADAAFLEVRSGRRPAVRDEAPAGPAQTTVRCSADALLPLLAGEPGVVATVEGERRPLELVQGWFADATSA